MCVITSNIAALLPKCIDVKIYSDMSYQQAALTHLHSNVLKKFHDDKMSNEARKAAVAKFLESNSICKNFQWNQESYYYDIALRVRDRLYEIFHSGPLQSNLLDMFSIVQNCMPGPGSSLGTKETAFYGKLFKSKLTTYDSTGALYRYWSDNLDYRWKAAEKARLSEYGLDYRTASNMSFAHKNLDEARTINTEASLEMLLQKGAASIIEGLLRRFYNIDIRKQPSINRLLARLGSLDGSFATIDLKDGSNRISTKFYELVLPRSVFLALNRIRAKRIVIPKSLSDIQGEIDLEMFSTQGDGFTFALQTLMFASITEAVYESMGLPTDCHTYPHFSVFGDDIICTKHAFYKLSRTLEFCGFTVNADKSFNSGSFRESCGADFFKGHNIRSVYIKRIRHERHKYSVFNRLLIWSIRCGVDLTALLRYIKGLVDFRPVPLDETDEAGLRLPLEFSDVTANKFGVYKYKAWSPEQKFVNIRRRFDSINDDGMLLASIHGSLVSRVSRRSKRTAEFPLGRIESVHDGYLERQQSTRYVERQKTTSSWDFCPKGLTPLDYRVALLAVL